MKTYTTKEISERSDLPIPTLRYYEQIGLIDPVDRAENGHRRYTDCDLRRIEFLKRVRATGMSIAEMQYYVDLYRRGDEQLEERIEILEAHRASVQAQVEALQGTIAFLDTKLKLLYQDRVELVGAVQVES